MACRRGPLRFVTPQSKSCLREPDTRVHFVTYIPFGWRSRCSRVNFVADQRKARAKRYTPHEVGALRAGGPGGGAQFTGARAWDRRELVN